MPYKDLQVRKEKAREYSRLWKKRQSPEKLAEMKIRDNAYHRIKRSRETTKDKIINSAKSRKAYQQNPVIRERRWKDAKIRYHKLRKDVLIHLGGRCSNKECRWLNSDTSRGCTDFRCLQIDHIGGGGTKEFRSMSTHSFLSKVLNDTSGRYQCLCANCNWIKRVEQKEFSKGRPSIAPDLEPPD